MQRAGAESASGGAPDAVSHVTVVQPAKQAPADVLWTDKYRPGSADEVPHCRVPSALYCFLT